jgi:hypothetical protein
MKPVVSLYCPSVRPHLWMRLYESLIGNKISFQLVFVGSEDPPYIPPANMIHVHTKVKPVQCAEIGLRVSEGEYCMFIADDLIFSPHALDSLYAMAKSDSNVVPSCIPFVNGKSISTSFYRFFPFDDTGVRTHGMYSPITPLGGMYKKKTIQELGGIDKNFICTSWDIDLAIRFYNKGGICAFCYSAIADEIVVSHSGRLATEGEADRNLLERLWTMKFEEYVALPPEKRPETLYVDPKLARGVILRHRSAPVDPFTDPAILEMSQGPKGRWE